MRRFARNAMRSTAKAAGNTSSGSFWSRSPPPWWRARQGRGELIHCRRSAGCRVPSPCFPASPPAASLSFWITAAGMRMLLRDTFLACEGMRMQRLPEQLLAAQVVLNGCRAACAPPAWQAGAPGVEEARLLLPPPCPPGPGGPPPRGSRLLPAPRTRALCLRPGALWTRGALCGKEKKSRRPGKSVVTNSPVGIPGRASSGRV